MTPYKSMSQGADDVEHDAENDSRVDGTHDVAERHPYLMDPKQASWKYERG